MKKSLFCILLVLALVLVPALAFADDTDVTAEVDETYTITIPATVNFGTIVRNSGTQSQPFEVTASDVFLDPRDEIRVNLTTTLSNDNRGGMWLTHDTVPLEWDIPYALYNSTNQVGITDDFVCFETNRTESGHIDVNTDDVGGEPVIYAPGSYTDTMTFTIGVYTKGT